jgi:hypothetical protein
MGKAIEYSPITQGMSGLKGIVAGSLIAGGIINSWGIGIQAILFIVGIVIMVDSCIPDGRTFILTTVIFAVFGGVITLLVTIVGYSVYYTILIIVAAVLVYLKRISNRKKRAEISL